MKTLTKALALALALLLAGACLAAETRTFFAMDTVMTLNVPGADAALLDACEAEVRRLEALLSVTDPDSEIARLNAGGSLPLSEDTRTVLCFALDTAALTGGALDVTLYPVVRAWGFTTGAYRVPDAAEIAELLEHVGWERVILEDGTATLEDGMMVDLGALAKGYASDRLAECLRAGGVRSALIDLGGNIYCIGAKKDGSDWRVGVRDPGDPEGFIGAIAVRDRAVITSGCYQRNFTGDDGVVYGHIFDPATGRPASSGLTSVTVVGARGLECDALSTALYVMGAQRAAALLPTLGVEALLADEDAALWVTEGLRGAFTPMGRWQAADIHWIAREDG